MSAYYNEHDRFLAGWLRNLIAAGLICDGEVDERSILDVTPEDVAGYTQCHFFAGLGLWSLALRWAGWSDDRPIWTGSCPCQPFSQAGRGGGFADDRHLWPAWEWLISQCKPVALAGEQVASPDGRAWLDVVSASLETRGYAVGAVDFPVSGVGGPNIRQRLWWVANAASAVGAAIERDRDARGFSGSADGGGLGNAGPARLPDAEPSGVFGTGRRPEGRAAAEPSCASDPWRELEWIACRDGRWRPAQSGIFPLAPRRPGDVAKLRAYGNAISPVVAAEVIAAWMELEG